MIVTSVQIKTVKMQKHLYCPVFTEPAVVIPLQVFIYASCSSFSGRLNIPFMAFAEASCAE